MQSVHSILMNRPTSKQCRATKTNLKIIRNAKMLRKITLKRGMLHEKGNLPWRAAADTSKRIRKNGAFLGQRVSIGTSDLVISIHSQLHARIVGWNTYLIIDMAIQNMSSNIGNNKAQAEQFLV